MLSIFILSVLVTTIVVALCGALYVTAVQASPVLAPAAIGPFAPGTSDPTADTMTSQAHMNTVFTDGGWNSVTLNRLCDVEDFLDQLEAHNVAEREMVTLNDTAFAVRWK